MEFSSKNNSNPLNLGLGKILAAAAWMDGNLKDNELERLTALVLQMPNISFEDWRKLEDLSRLSHQCLRAKRHCR